MEPPSFFILSVASVLATSFGFCLYCLKNNIPQEKAFVRFWLYWGAFNVILYLILMVVLVLMTQLDTEDDVTITCYGRSVEVDESFTIQVFFFPPLLFFPRYSINRFQFQINIS